MALLAFLLFGLVVGLVARAIIPGRQSMSLVMTTLLGVAGSFIGGFFAALVTKSKLLEFNTAGAIGSIIGAVALLFAVMAYERRGHRI